MTSSPESSDAPELLGPPSAVHRAGEVSVLAEYPDTRAVLAAAAALRALAPPHLVDLVPAERTLLLVGAAPRDRHELTDLLSALPAATEEQAAGAEHTLAVVYDGADLAEVADLLSMSTDTLIAAHTGALWTVAFGGFAPGFPYLVAEGAGADGVGADGTGVDGSRADRSHADRSHADRQSAAGPPWEVPRRGEPRTTVPAGAVGLASRYCGIYPRPSPGGWQLIGRTDAELFDPDRTPPALLVPGSRVRFSPRRPSARIGTRSPTTSTTSTTSTTTMASALARARSGVAVAPRRLSRRRGDGATLPPVGDPTLEVLSPGPQLLLQDAGRPGHGAIGVSPSGAFDRGALARADAAVGNPTHVAALEALLGPVRLRALAPTVIAVAGGAGEVTVHRADPEGPELELDAGQGQVRAIGLDPGDVLTLGAPWQGLRRLIAVRGGIAGVRRASDGVVRPAGAADGEPPASDVPFLGSLSRDTLSGLGPAPLRAGDVLLVGPEQGLDAVPDAVPEVVPEAVPRTDRGDPADDTSGDGQADGHAERSPARHRLEIPMHAGPRDALLGRAVLDALIRAEWTVRSDSDRVGVRMDGSPLPVPDGSGSLPSEAMVPGAIQVPPSGLPVVFGPDHPTTGGYPVVAVVTRTGLDRLAQAAPGTAVRFTPAAGSAR
ncbi:MAG: carboxyltransferase domain-containing protein [Brachybacterium tyrofermentans]|uniref:5-oxoprolinase subunit B/C family protein n=1 Tax=Brachybacterium tyrofermentans TaxID=47848 RepID=UPI003F9056A5